MTYCTLKQVVESCKYPFSMGQVTQLRRELSLELVVKNALILTKEIFRFLRKNLVLPLNILKFVSL